MKKTQFSLLFALAGLLLATTFEAWAQPQGYREEITVVAPYEPTISDAFKISLRARTGDTIPEKKQFEYEIRSVVLETPFNPTLLKPARLEGEPLVKLYKNYLRAGFGTQSSPLLEYHYNSLRSKDIVYGLRMKHHSSSGKIDGYGEPGTSENDLGFYLHRIGRKGNTLATRLDLNRDVYHFYGFKTDELAEKPAKDDYRQRYTNIGAWLSWFSHDHEEEKLRHKIDLDFSHLSDKSDNRELNVNFGAGVTKNLDVFDFSDKQELSLKLGSEVFHNTVLDSSIGSAAIVSLEPGFHTQVNEFELTVGVKADMSIDTSSSVAIYPVAEVRIHVLESALNIFFGMDGGTERNSYAWFISENPFIGDNIPIGFRETKSRFFGGVEGRLGQRISFNATLAASKVERMPFFINDTNYLQGSRFSAVLDEANLFDVTSTFAYQHGRKWQGNAKMHLRQYSATETEPWHIPELSASIGGSYNLRDKVVLSAEIYHEGKRTYLVYEGEDDNTAELKAFTDINLALEYRYSKILSGFIDVNNILGTGYQKWAGYPVYGFGLLAGVTYAF